MKELDESLKFNTNDGVHSAQQLKFTIFLRVTHFQVDFSSDLRDNVVKARKKQTRHFSSLINNHQL